MKDEIEGKKNKRSGQLKKSFNKVNLKKQKETKERICFVITKQKTNSWVEDLYACGQVVDNTRVYH